MANGRSTARFGDATTGTNLTFVCESASRSVMIGRPGNATGTVPMSITTTGTRRLLSAVPVTSSPPILWVTLAATDPLLDAIAFSRGRFMVEAPGLPTLYVPNWPEISRVIEDCR
jgi:hypothetical protein